MRIALLSLLLCASPAFAQADSEAPVIRRGAVTLSVADVEVRLRGATPEVRAAIVSSADRMEHLLDDMLLQRQLRAESDRLKLQEDPLVAAEMRQLIDTFLSRKALERLIAEEGTPNFDVLARERFLVARDEWVAPAMKRIRHVLIATQDRDESEARKLAEEVRAAALSGTPMADLVLQRSDDPSKINNGGVFEVTADAPFDPAFKAAALALSKDAPLSELVRSEFGFHVIEYLDEKPQRELTLDEAKPEIVKALRADWESKRRDAILSGLRAQPSEVFESGMEKVSSMR